MQKTCDLYFEKYSSFKKEKYYKQKIIAELQTF